MKKLILNFAFFSAFSLNASILEKVAATVEQIADKGKSCYGSATEWVAFQACIAQSKNNADQKKCFTDLIDAKNVRIQKLEEEVASLKALK